MTHHISTQALRRQALLWVLGILALSLFLFVFRAILLPFLAGFAIAYFLDPVADFLERRKFSRLMATVLILLAFIVLFVIALLIVIPVLINQATEFLARVPGYIDQLRTLVAGANLENIWFLQSLGIDSEALKSSVDSLVQQGSGIVSGFVQGLWSSGVALVNIVGLLVVAPVVAFYMLLDWDRMVARVDSWIPRNQVDTIRTLGRDVNKAIAGFVRGQGTVCLILGLFYGTALSVAGLNFGLLIGLFAGLISFVPYVGSMVGLVLSVGVALVQFWPDYISIGIVAGIFIIGQMLEGNILQPKLVGESVGLHPVWLMFALFAFGSLFGFVGMLVAVPASAAIGVLVRFAMDRYLDSDLYEDPAKRSKKSKPQAEA